MSDFGEPEPLGSVENPAGLPGVRAVGPIFKTTARRETDLGGGHFVLPVVRTMKNPVSKKFASDFGCRMGVLERLFLAKLTSAEIGKW